MDDSLREIEREAGEGGPDARQRFEVALVRSGLHRVEAQRRAWGMAQTDLLAAPFMTQGDQVSRKLHLVGHGASRRDKAVSVLCGQGSIGVLSLPRLAWVGRDDPGVCGQCKKADLDRPASLMVSIQVTHLLHAFRHRPVRPILRTWECRHGVHDGERPCQRCGDPNKKAQPDDDWTCPQCGNGYGDQDEGLKAAKDEDGTSIVLCECGARLVG